MKKAEQELLKIAVDWVREAKRLYGTELGGKYKLVKGNDKLQERINGALNSLCSVGAVGGDPVGATCLELERLLWRMLFSVSKATEDLENLWLYLDRNGLWIEGEQSWDMIIEIENKKEDLFGGNDDINDFLFDVVKFYKMIQKVKVGDV